MGAVSKGDRHSTMEHSVNISSSFVQYTHALFFEVNNFQFTPTPSESNI